MNRRAIPLLSLLLATACTKARQEQASTEPTNDCYACHGSTENGNPAPPPMLGQPNAPKDVHQSHLHGANWHGPMACDNCHPVPAQVTDPLHLDGKVEVTFEDEATDDGATPAYDATTHTCTGTYCHGGTIAGGDLTAPQWLAVGQDEAHCGACHSLPPTENHEQTDTLCFHCHGTVVDSSLTFINPELHVNGKVDFSTGGCDSCHGSNGNPAPPVALDGSSDRTDLGVGAHRQHLGASSWHKVVACSECHQVPATFDDPVHLDPQQLVHFGPTATANSTPATWSPGAATCSVYCHGVSLPDDGGSDTQPKWNVIPATSPLPCDTCHGDPPGGQHPPRTDCSSCHTEVNADGKTFANPALHIDGTINVKTIECNLCHGNAAGDPNVVNNWAPPVDTQDRSDPSLMSVGTHQQHLATSTTFATVPCSACHLVPTAVSSPGHIDGQVTITYAFPATANGAPTSFNTTSGQCTNWCHGSGLLSPNPTPPVFNQPFTPACTSCHGYPPPTPHPDRNDCSTCHPTGGSNQTITQAALHVNGTVDVVPFPCNSCHGNAAGDPDTQANWAPPVDAEGRSDTALPSVGAHQLHLGTPTFGHRPVVCSDCHTVPATVTTPLHIDAVVQLTWSDVAAHGTTPSFDTTANTCNVYCHGASFPAQGGPEVTPTWVSSGGTFPTPSCGAQCHAYPPPAPHVQVAQCSLCHTDVDPANNLSFTTPELHINGSVDF